MPFTNPSNWGKTIVLVFHGISKHIKTYQNISKKKHQPVGWTKKFFDAMCSTNRGPPPSLECLRVLSPQVVLSLASTDKNNNWNTTDIMQTRWSPRTRMPTRMLSNRDDTYLSHFPANPLVGHPDLTHWGDTLVGHPCLTLLRNTLLRHSCLTLL